MSKKLPTGWTFTTLRTCVDVLDGKRVPINSAERAQRIAGKSNDALFPYFGATGQVGLIDGYIFDEPLILLGEDGVPFFDPLRHKAYLVDGKVWVNNHAHVLRANSVIADRRFLCAYLNVADYTGVVSGSTRLKLTQAAMNMLPVPLPPLSEQRRIADKLDTLLVRIDACRERLDRVPGLIKRFRLAVLESAVNGDLTLDWRSGRPFQTESHQFGNLIGEAQVGLVRSAAEQHACAPGLARYVKMNNIAEYWGVDVSSMVAVNCDANELARFCLRDGDWLFNTRNSVELVGKSCVWRGGSAVYNNNLLRVRFKLDKVLPDYIEIWFRSPTGRTVLAGIKSATTSVAAIYQRSLMALSVELPSVEEQAEVVCRVEKLFALADALESRLRTARGAADQLTPAMLNKAFRGELVPQDPSDEPAQALFDRLKSEPAGAAPVRRGRRAATAESVG